MAPTACSRQAVGAIGMSAGGRPGVLAVRGAPPRLPRLALDRQGLAVRAPFEQAEGERALASQVSLHTDLAGCRTGVHGVLVVAEHRLDGLHALGETACLLA